MRKPFTTLSHLPILESYCEERTTVGGHTVIVPRVEPAEIVDFQLEDVIFQEIAGELWTLAKKDGVYYRKLFHAL